MVPKAEEGNTWYIVLSMIGFFTCVILLLFIICGCTINLQNTSSNGKASDLVDDVMESNPTISPDISVPIKAI